MICQSIPGLNEWPDWSNEQFRCPIISIFGIGDGVPEFNILSGNIEAMKKTEPTQYESNDTPFNNRMGSIGFFVKTVSPARQTTEKPTNDK